MSSLAGKYYSTPDECPIWNFYKAQEDIKFLLKEPKKLNAVNEAFLKSVLFDLQDFFSQKMSSISYKNNLNDFLGVMQLTNKIRVIESLLKALEFLREDLRLIEIDAYLPNLSEILQNWKIAKRVTVKDQIETLKREIKGINNGIKIITARHKNVVNETNWMKTVVMASKIWGSRIDPKVTTLAEWVEILKIVEKEAGHGRGN